MIRRSDILRGHEKDHPINEQLDFNLQALLICINKLQLLYGKPFVITSGYRPPEYNAKVGGAKNSAHLYCQAVDISDPDGEIYDFCTEDILLKCGLYKEDNDGGKRKWLHYQTRPTKNRIFKP